MSSRSGAQHSPTGLRRKRKSTNRHAEGSEFDIQRRFTEYIDTTFPDLLWCASAGGARTSMREAVRLKQSGYKRGFPDVFIYEPRGPFHGLSIELKKPKGGRVSTHQKEWKQRLSERGFKATIAKGYDEAVTILTDYLDGGD